MEENYQGYNQPEYENDDPRKGANKSILGYRIVIIILAVILAAITVLYYNIHRQQQADYDLLVIDRDSIQNNLSDLMQDFDDLQLSNDTLSLQMGIERQRADSLMQRLKQERSWSLAKIKQYEKEVGTLRTIMRGYLHQIDSLNTLNKKLIDENVSYRKEITTAQMRAEMAEEKAQELNNKVRQGSVINARGIRMVALNARSKEVSRIKNAERLRVDFTLTANALATPGEKTIYVRILSPDGYVLSSESVPTFEFEGERLSYSASRDVDYQNEDLNIGIFYTGSGFTAGTYQVLIYCVGVLVGSIALIADMFLRVTFWSGVGRRRGSRSEGGGLQDVFMVIAFVLWTLGSGKLGTGLVRTLFASDGTFVSAAFVEARGSMLRIGDVDGDRLADAVVFDNGKAFAFSGRSPTLNARAPLTLAPTWGVSPNLFDFDGDGLDEVYYTTPTQRGKIVIVQNQSE